MKKEKVLDEMGKVKCLRMKKISINMLAKKLGLFGLRESEFARYELVKVKDQATITKFIF